MADFTMRVEMVDISTLKPADYNPRKPLPARERLALRRSIEKFGMVYPLVVNKRNNVVVGGHQRLREMTDMGYEEAPVLWVDMDEEQERRANIQLNSIEADFDQEKLQELLYPKVPDEIEAMGFSKVEAKALLAGIFMNPESKKQMLKELSETKEKLQKKDETTPSGPVMFTCPKCGYRADSSEFLITIPPEEKQHLTADENGSDEQSESGDAA